MLSASLNPSFKETGELHSLNLKRVRVKVPLSRGAEKMLSNYDRDRKLSTGEQEEAFIPHLPYSRHNPHLLDWNFLKTFYYVATAGNLTRAADYLHLSQPALSRTIRKLEDRLGEKLFVRGGQKLVLTRAGEVAFEAVSNTFGQIEFLGNKIEEDK